MSQIATIPPKIKKQQHRSKVSHDEFKNSYKDNEYQQSILIPR